MGKYSEYFLMHENMLICTTCSWAIPKPKDCTTSSLRHHLRKKHPELYNCFKDREDRTRHERATAAERALAVAHGLKLWKSEPEAGPETPQAKRPCWNGAPSSSAEPQGHWEHERVDSRMDNIERAITQMLCTTALPSSFLDSPGFHNLLGVTSPRFQMKSRAHFSQNSLGRLHEEYANKIRTMLNPASFVSFSTDVRMLPGTSQSLLTFTVHFIDDMMVPRFATVSASLIDGLPTESETRALLNKALNSFEVSQERSHILVEHWPINAAGSTTMRNVSDFTQKLQKAVDEGLRLLLNENDSFMHNVKEAGRWLCKAESEKIFRQCNRLCSETAEGAEMCWSCLYTLLCRMIEQKNSLAFALAEAIPEHVKFDGSDWERIREIVGVLKPIDFAIGLVKHRYFTPISVVIPLYKVILRQLRGDSSCLEAVKDAICSTLEDVMSGCEDRDEFFLATFVDPRFRSAYFTCNKRQEILEKLEDMAFLPVQAPVSTAEPTFEDSSNPFIAFRKFEPPAASSPANPSKIEAGTRALAELEDYLSQDPSFATDPYEFWQNEVNSAKYPLIKKLASKYLSAPGISVDCQAVFSQLELLNGDLRKNWEPEELDKLLFLHHNILIFGF